jgi:hypothetical protein
MIACVLTMSENRTRQLQLVKTEVGNEPRAHRHVRFYLSVFVGGIALSGASFVAGVHGKGAQVCHL